MPWHVSTKLKISLWMQVKHYISATGFENIERYIRASGRVSNPACQCGTGISLLFFPEAIGDFTTTPLNA